MVMNAQWLWLNILRHLKCRMDSWKCSFLKRKVIKIFKVSKVISYYSTNKLRNQVLEIWVLVFNWNFVFRLIAESIVVNCDWIIWNVHCNTSGIVIVNSRNMALYLLHYSCRLSLHIDSNASANSPEADNYRQTLTAYFIVKSPFKTYYNNMNFRKNSRFLKRLTERTKHTYMDVISFIDVHREQYGFFKRSSLTLEYFVLKYFSVKPPWSYVYVNNVNNVKKA